MTAYRRLQTLPSLSEAAKRAKAASDAAKAKRQAILERVRKQRAAAYKRTAQEWIQVGAIIRASELKKRYT